MVLHENLSIRWCSHRLKAIFSSGISQPCLFEGTWIWKACPCQPWIVPALMAFPRFFTAGFSFVLERRTDDRGNDRMPRHQSLLHNSGGESILITEAVLSSGSCSLESLDTLKALGSPWEKWEIPWIIMMIAKVIWEVNSVELSGATIGTKHTHQGMFEVWSDWSGKGLRFSELAGQRGPSYAGSGMDMFIK